MVRGDSHNVIFPAFWGGSKRSHVFQASRQLLGHKKSSFQRSVSGILQNPESTVQRAVHFLIRNFLMRLIASGFESVGQGVI